MAKYQTKFVFFQLSACALTTFYQTNLGYIAQSPFFIPFTISEKKAHDLWDTLAHERGPLVTDLFLRFDKCYEKMFCIVVGNPLSRDLGNVAKVYLIIYGLGPGYMFRVEETYPVGHSGHSKVSTTEFTSLFIII